MNPITKFICQLAVFSTLAAPAAANMECSSKPALVERFVAIMDDDRPYTVLYGQLQFDQALLRPEYFGIPIPPPSNLSISFSPFVAQFTGHQLTMQGFTHEMDLEIAIEPICAGSWCPALKSENDVLFSCQQIKMTLCWKCTIAIPTSLRILVLKT